METLATLGLAGAASDRKQSCSLQLTSDPLVDLAFYDSNRNRITLLFNADALA